MKRIKYRDIVNQVTRINRLLGLDNQADGAIHCGRAYGGYQVQRDRGMGIDALTPGFRPAREVMRYLDGMADGLRLAKGQEIGPSAFYASLIKPDAQFCDNCASPIVRATACVVPALRTDCVSASAGESATLCCRCYELHEAGAHLICPSCGRACESATTVCDSDDCPWNDPPAPPPSDCCPITGEEYGTGA